MNYGVVLAGGTGTRMGGEIPKQFMNLCGKPILLWTLEKLISIEDFNAIYIAVHSDYINYLQKLLNDFCIKDNRIEIINGGKERINSIENALQAICENEIGPDDVVVIHDGVRPFVSTKILRDSINVAREYGACVAVVPAIDTMYILNDDRFIKDFPHRATIFNGQAPDSFKVQVLKCALDSLSAEERKTITGTVQICSLKGYQIKTIPGDYKNIKITTQDDMFIAEKILTMEFGEKNESWCP